MAEKITDPGIEKKQALRKKRHKMAFATYAVPFMLVLLCWHQKMIPVEVVYQFAFFALLINVVILFLIHKNINLKFRDPSLTTAHLAVSPFPTLWVMYFLQNGQARTAFLMIIVVAALYGILELNIRRFLAVCLWIFFLYAVLMVTLWLRSPEVLILPLEAIQAIAFLMVMITIAMIGGYISNLREKLRNRNQELTKAIDRIEELVNIDTLTGIGNRRYLFDVLSEELNRSSRARTPFSVCIMDIDHFKSVNDTYGHLAGDSVLCKITDEISKDIRSIDCFGRYGGEEFLLILSHTQLKGAAAKAEKVRRQVEAMDFPEIAEDLKLTFSLGVAQYREKEDIDTILLRADKALYTAKKKGRNRVCTEEDPELEYGD